MISDKTRKNLWALSGNKCAICRTDLVYEKDPFNRTLNIGEECHIISGKNKGPRNQTLESYNFDQYDNLLLLCCNHHKMIDEKVEEYTENKLRDIKSTHEKWVRETLNSSITSKKREKSDNKNSIVEFVINKYKTEMTNSTNDRLLNSYEGYQQMIKEITHINEYARKIIEEIQLNTPQYHIKLRDNKQYLFDVIFKGHTLLIQFYQTLGDRVEGSYLLFAIVDGYFDENGYAVPFVTTRLEEVIRLDYSFDNGNNFGWRDRENDNSFYSSEKITDIWISNFFKQLLQ